LLEIQQDYAGSCEKVAKVEDLGRSSAHG
jgi:hypothetical protein